MNYDVSARKRLAKVPSLIETEIVVPSPAARSTRRSAGYSRIMSSEYGTTCISFSHQISLAGFARTNVKGPSSGLCPVQVYLHWNVRGEPAFHSILSLYINPGQLFHSSVLFNGNYKIYILTRL